MLDYLKRHEPIGCRDHNTRNWLASAGVKAFFSGCVTTTLDLPTDTAMPTLSKTHSQHGAHYQVDDLSEDIPGAVKLTHVRRSVKKEAFTNNIKLSLDMLLDYKRARSVSTSRLHCYLPCRAMGTPVRFDVDPYRDIRFGGLVNVSEDEFEHMRSKLTNLLSKTLSLIFSGADTKTVYRSWQEMTLPLTQSDT